MLKFLFVKISTIFIMPIIEFYIINQDIVYSTCTLIEKIYNTLEKQHKITIYCNTHTQAKNLDELLWNIRQEAFIPHTIGESKAPIIISTHNNIIANTNICIDLTDNIPHDWQKFNTLIEIVDDNLEQTKSIHRKYYREYKAFVSDIKTNFVKNM